jgi:hypothetical protein
MFIRTSIQAENFEFRYGRIFRRLNELPSSWRDRAKRLLGWIGCSPVPLTRHEVEQALCIEPGDLEQKAEVNGPLNLLKLCGPIVEVVNDTIYFVHFTVKE